MLYQSQQMQWYIKPNHQTEYMITMTQSVAAKLMEGQIYSTAKETHIFNPSFYLIKINNILIFT